jgi:hypothetical protein
MPERPKLFRKNATDEPGELVAFPGAYARTRPGNNLPLQLSSLIGRHRERTKAGRLLAERRLLTLTGPGGSGKTRLALAVAGDVAEDFEDGVWWVALAPLSDPEFVPQAVAWVLEVREGPGRPLIETLADHLASRETLLILDNCEHLVEACERLAGALLYASPNLRILATSREPLGVAGETVLLVPPLSLPDPGHPPAPEELERYEAVRLFVERAGSATPTFELTERNASTVALLCRNLDGIPLAIELAAARTKVLSVAQISSRLADNFWLLKGASRTADPRQQTLAATLEWSHELLGKPSGPSSAACRFSPVDLPWERRRGSAPQEASKRTTCWICSRAWSTSRSCRWRNAAGRRRDTGCSRPSGSTPGRSSGSRASRKGLDGGTQGTILRWPKRPSRS